MGTYLNGLKITDPGGAILSGTHTPTLVNGTNVAASSPALSTYLRIGAGVSGVINLVVDPSAAAPSSTDLTFTLPIACTTTPTGGGVAVSYTGGGGATQSGIVTMASSTTGRLLFEAQAAGNVTWKISYQYVIN